MSRDSNKELGLKILFLDLAIIEEIRAIEKVRGTIKWTVEVPVVHVEGRSWRDKLLDGIDKWAGDKQDEEME